MLKRFCDIFVSTVGGLGLSPFAFCFALAVKLEDGGPIFYTQERWGREGKKFKAYKFRTMIQDADKKYGFKPAEENDIRITKVGKFLRATAMDELPQLINIWKGDMSFVGPRALAVGEVDPSVKNFQERHRVRPGLTGPAQVYASRDATLEEKFEFDLKYVQNQSPLYDFSLMLLSVWVTLRGKWETRQKKI